MDYIDRLNKTTVLQEAIARTEESLRKHEATLDPDSIIDSWITRDHEDLISRYYYQIEEIRLSAHTKW